MGGEGGGGEAIKEVIKNLSVGMLWGHGTCSPGNLEIYVFLKF